MNQESVFDLLGQRETSLTKALGWCLLRSDHLAEEVRRTVNKRLPTRSRLRTLDERHVNLERATEDRGRLDIEVTTSVDQLIIEAKRWWDFPARGQLERYVRDGSGSGISRNQVVVVIANGSRAFAEAHPNFVRQIDVRGRTAPVTYLSWEDVVSLAKKARARAGKQRERFALEEFISYLSGKVTMRNITSNEVYVVSLARGAQDWCPVPPIELVEEYNTYFHPIGDGYPKEPENYLGFRYNGHLQRVSFVESVVATERLGEAFKKWPFSAKGYPSSRKFDAPHFVYRLGPNLLTDEQKIETGKPNPQGRPHRIAIDLLLSEPSVVKARDAYKRREAKRRVD